MTTAADFIKFVGEVIIITLFLIMMFGGESGIGSNIITYLTYAEPLYLQEYLSGILTAATYVPGDLRVGIELTAVQHKIDISSKDQQGKEFFVSVTPGQKVILPFTGKAEFTSPERPLPFPGRCALSSDPLSVTLKKGTSQQPTQKLDVKKEGDPCKISVVPR